MAFACQYIISSAENLPSLGLFLSGTSVDGTRATLVEISLSGGASVLPVRFPEWPPYYSETLESSMAGRTFSKFVLNGGGRWS